MEWSKEKTLKLVELLQENPVLWNPHLCFNRRDKQKRKDEIRRLTKVLGMTWSDTTKKIQHLRTQYNREAARLERYNEENPEEPYVSSWYAFEYLHFLKDSTKPYSILQSKKNQQENPEDIPHSGADCKLNSLSPPPQKIQRTDSIPSIKEEQICRNRDDFSVFGEYVANELRSLKGEKNQVIAKKKILDVIFEFKMGVSCERPDEFTVYNQGQRHGNTLNDKSYDVPLSSAHIQPLNTHTTPTSGISEILINSVCHYPNFKVDTHSTLSSPS